jgi:thioredoxin-related protein
MAETAETGRNQGQNENDKKQDEYGVLCYYSNDIQHHLRNMSQFKAHTKQHFSIVVIGAQAEDEVDFKKPDSNNIIYILDAHVKAASKSDIVKWLDSLGTRIYKKTGTISRIVH